MLLASLYYGVAHGSSFTEPYRSLYQERVRNRTEEDYLLLQLPDTLGKDLTERYRLIEVEQLPATYHHHVW